MVAVDDALVAVDDALVAVDDAWVVDGDVWVVDGDAWVDVGDVWVDVGDVSVDVDVGSVAVDVVSVAVDVVSVAVDVVFMVDGLPRVPIREPRSGDGGELASLVPRNGAVPGTPAEGRRPTAPAVDVSSRAGPSYGVPRFFNTAGPNQPERHYTLPGLARLPAVRELIDQGLYFVVHAPRQVGKTTSLLHLGHELTAEGGYVAVLVSMEVGEPFPHDPGAAELAILDAWRSRTEAHLPPELQPPSWPEAAPGSRIGTALRAWARAAPRPLVVLLDEMDALQDETLISILRQIRDGYGNRPSHFPHSLALVGLRDVRDYKVACGGSDRLGTASPFNIKADSLTLRNFTRDEVAALYGQHTAETGQVFVPEAVDQAFSLTQGQPWLVNALARQLTQVLVRDRAEPIVAAKVDEAAEILIRRQDTHLDSLIERLREPRVRAVIEPMLAGEMLGDMPEDDLRFVLDLGLVREDPAGGIVVANPIYREIIVRALSFSRQASLPQIPVTWLTPGGRLDKGRLLRSFMDFWAEHGEPLLRAAPYHEVAPHLVLMAFLHRVVNGGSISREYAIGRSRMDLCLRHAGETLAIEIKVWRPGRPDPQATGLAQLDGYLAGLGLDEGWLVIFDRRPGLPPVEERLTSSEETSPAGNRVTVIRA